MAFGNNSLDFRLCSFKKKSTMAGMDAKQGKIFEFSHKKLRLLLVNGFLITSESIFYVLKSSNI